MLAGFGVAQAAPVTGASVGDWQYLYTSADDPSNHLTGTDFGGVGRVVINGSGLCSGALLNTGGGASYVLTAAHCVTNLSGTPTISSGSVRFDAPGGPQTIGVNAGATMIHPDWNGNPLRGNDLAILELTGTPSAAVDAYAVYGGTAEIGVVGDKVGYGRIGTGAAGSIGGSAGTKHDGQNIYDTAINFASGSGVVPNALLLYDFDDGSAYDDVEGRDASGALGHATGQGSALEQTGTGAANEVISAPGDSGGPTFIAADGGPAIAGVTSFGFRGLTIDASPVVCGPVGAPDSCDIDGVINSSFGEWAVDMRVSAYLPWLTSVLPTLVVFGDTLPPPPEEPPCEVTNTCPPENTSSPDPETIPEPGSLGLVALGVAAAGILRRRRR